MKYIGIDYGLARTGLAVSDPEGRLAFPLATVRLADYADRKAFLTALADRIAGEGGQAVVMGLPLLDDGSDSLTTRQVRNVAARLQRRVPLPFYFMPELLSSEEAWGDLREAGLKAGKRRAVLDQQAAVRILGSFLALDADARQRQAL
ncbi:MAG: Holliday junction resolvase RuvX [Desulfovibrionaceae bacterium]|nr:Holliday junction resolvase RuvX [Desulfovibrionaceae bacterium]